MRKNKKIIIIISIIVLLAIGLYLYFISNKELESEKQAVEEIDTNIDYNEDDEIGDFSDAETISVDLSKESGNYNITSYGIYVLTGTLKGSIIIDTTSNVKVILNDVTITSNNGPAIYVANAKNTYIEFTGINTLTDSSSYSNYDTDVDGVIFSHDDLILSGTGTLNIKSNYNDGIVSKDDLKFLSGTYIINSKDDGIRGKDSVVIKDGTYTINAKGDGIKSTNDTDTEKGYVLIENGNFNITSTLDGIQAETKLLINDGTFKITTGNGSSTVFQTYSSSEDSSKGLKSVSNIVIDNGNFNINSYDDAIHSNDSIGIKNGTFTIASSDDGIHADTSLVIDNGTINISKSYEGLEATNITINDGDIDIISSDDGINVAGGNDSSSFGRPGANNFNSNSNAILTINGGDIYVNASGDGLDANGSITINGGNVIVDGPTDNGNGALDYDSSFTVNGGTLIAIGSSGMAQNISGGTVNAVLINLNSNQSANTVIKIGDIISYTPSKSFSSILVVTNDLVKNNTYTLTLNGNTYTSFTISSTINNVGSNNGMGGQMQRR